MARAASAAPGPGSGPVAASKNGTASKSSGVLPAAADETSMIIVFTASCVFGYRTPLCLYDNAGGVPRPVATREAVLAEPGTAPAVTGYHHFAPTVSDVESSARWYERVFGMTRVPRDPDNIQLELIYMPRNASTSAANSA